MRAINCGAGVIPHRRKKRKIAYGVFIIVALAYPVIRFLITWGYVNVSAIWSTFQYYDFMLDKYEPAKFTWYEQLFNRIRYDEATRIMLLNSFKYFPVTCFISLPLAILFSFFLYKKVPMSSVYRVIFYLPSILPIAVLAMSFRFAFNGNFGFIDPIVKPFFKLFGKDVPLWFGKTGLTPNMIFAYCIWAGLGFNIVLLSGSMSRVPMDVVEYGKLEGVGLFREMFQIMIPMIWPTIITTFVLGMSAPLTVYLQPYFLMGSSPEMPFGTSTISLYIFNNYSSETQAPYLAAFGLVCTLIYVPFILISRFVMTRFFKDVDY